MKEYILTIGEKEYSASVIDINDDTARISVDGNVYEVNIKEFGLNGDKPVKPDSGDAMSSPAPGIIPVPKAPVKNYSIASDGIRAPMPGIITRINVRQGERIKAGELVLVIEAMKMENEIKSPYDGIVGKIHIAENDNVSESDMLVELKRPAMTTL